ncbi:magnesium transporter [Gordonia sp. NPDC062954]|uniref:magnesium transporter n=1 Tax=unclassified Gordonia (in: high G+C Gram-positive bacteria) TaxID=2657482 RepID=UPI000C61CEB8|nr:magnesium transporter [Gordonia sp. (in: high G+C Gram-positive bacteria)]
MITTAADRIGHLVRAGDLPAVAADLQAMPSDDVAALIEQLPRRHRGVTFRLLGKEAANAVFDALPPPFQRGLVEELGTAEVASAFRELDPDDRAELLDELPASVAKALVRGLSPGEREITGIVLGYPRGSVGRRMSPEFVHAYPDETVAQALDRIRTNGRDAETIYAVPVVDRGRRLCGMLSLRDLLLADPESQPGEHMSEPIYAHALDDAEPASFRCVERGVLAMPVVDSENRLVGVLTIDDAVDVVEQARDVDEARSGARERLEEPYLVSSILSITRARIVWLFVLAVSAILTVNVLEIFEGTLEQEVALALFIPLLTGIGGNTGSQAATTITRALAVHELAPRDVLRVAGKEIRVGVTLGTFLGTVGFAVAAAVYGLDIGIVIGTTILAICALAATVGGIMPLIARICRVDPAVFSTPFISTFCDATGLIIYFTIAKSVLGI